MIAAGIDNRSVKLLAAGNVEAIFELFHFGAHGAEIARNERDAVRLFDAKFLCIADADAAAGVRPDGCEYGKFVDKLRGECSTDFGGTQAISSAVICTVPTSSEWAS